MTPEQLLAELLCHLRTETEIMRATLKANEQYLHALTTQFRQLYPNQADELLADAAWSTQ